MAEMVFKGTLDIFSIREDRYLRDCGHKGDLSELNDGEYFSFSLRAQNNGDREYVWEQAYVTVDEGEPWHWAKGSMPASSRANFHIAYCNMKKCMTPGVHTAIWYFDGQAVHTQRFTIVRSTNWEKVFDVPSKAEIARYRNPNNRRSPCIDAWLTIPPETRYTEYAVEFRAVHLPAGTYCCLANWTMDYSHLKKRYKSVRTEYQGVHAYAGFQKLVKDDMASIMSFWDVYCKDASGKEITIRAKRVFPYFTIGAPSFGGEGTGARCIAPYNWEKDHWYRMHLRCVVSPDTGNTVVEQWVCDMETGEYTLLCAYDTGVANAAFKGSIAVFLENYLEETAGEVRSMEVRNAKYRDADTNEWIAISKAYISPRGGAPRYEGSYNFGVSEDRLWMITSGVGGDWFQNGKGKRGQYLTL